MAPRLQLQALLEEITEHVYFQAPSNDKMQYPCIIYAREGSAVQFAGNTKYSHTKRYQVTVIDRNPDSTLPDEVEALPMCRLERVYTADTLYHFVFILFF